MATVPAGAGVSGRAACHHAEAEDVTTEPRNWSVNQLIKIGAKVVSRGRYITFQMAEVAVPRQTSCRSSPGCMHRQRLHETLAGHAGQEHPTGGVRPNAEENAQISPTNHLSGRPRRR